MKSDWGFKLSFVIINLCLIFVTFKYFKADHAYKKQLEITNKQQTTVDSLNTELFNYKCIVGRYDLTLDYLKEVNPNASKQFEYYLSHKTE
jgi:hypothetical protein